MKVLIGFLSILAISTAIPLCNENELNRLWPDSDSNRNYYQCISIGKFYRMPCSADTWFSFKDQKCVNKDQWVKSMGYELPTTPHQEMTTKIINGKSTNYHGPPTPKQTVYPMPGMPPHTAPVQPTTPVLTPVKVSTVKPPPTAESTTKKSVVVSVKKRRPKVVPTREPIV